MKKIHFLSILLCLLAVSLTAAADDYMNYLTTQRGFTEVKTVGSIDTGADNYYILVPAETREYIVGIGRYEDKPGWASEDSKALRYHSAATDPALVLSNFFTIEKATVSGTTYIGFRNVVYSADMFQTHGDAGQMYVNTFTDKDFDEWSYLIPTFQDGYWLFENGKYPMSSEATYKGYMGSWTPGRFAVDEPIALNRTNIGDDVAGHYRLFKISKTNLETLRRQGLPATLRAASASNPIDATEFIANPSFETGDETGWTAINRGNNDDPEFKPRDYGMSNKEGQFVFNAFQWWAPNIGVTQTIDLPSGEYTLSAAVCTWENRTVYFTGNDVTVNTTGTNDATGIPVSLDVNVGIKGKLTISAGSLAEWWADGHSGETQTFFKIDDVELTCKGLYLNGAALPLPNNNSTRLEAGQWYYYEVAYASEYRLIGNIDEMVYSTDGLKLLSEISTAATSREMILSKGRVYFKTTQSDVTLRILPKREINESTSSFTACALNVDGLPSIANSDGPASSGTKKISTYLKNKAYDIMGFSEDFNFDSELKSNITGYTWGTHRGSVSSLISNNTDGLQFACKNSTVTWANETYVAYTSVSSTDGNNMIKKGYRHYDVTFDGQLIDVYITHMDAGDNDAAKTSRNKQWKQLTEAINAVDNGREIPRPKIVMGDTNCRWTRDGVKANFLDLLSSNFTASDVWVEFCRNGIYPTTDMNDLTDQSDPTNFSNYEIVDKIIYINPKAANTVQLIPQNFLIEQDYKYDTIDHDGNTKALGDHPPVVVEFKYIKSGDIVPLALELADDADNTTTIHNTSDVQADVTLSGRTLKKDDSWNTICLPFNMTAEQVTSQLAPAGLMSYTGSSFDDSKGELTLNFTVATTITAGTPYIIKWASGDNITNPVFTGVTISNTNAAVVGSNGAASFVGTYAPVNIYTDAKTNLYLGDGNTLYYPTSTDFNVNAFRAYFQLNNGLTAGEPSSLVKSFVMNFDGERSTGLSPDPSPVGEGSAGAWYDLQGRKIRDERLEMRDKLPRGIYIHNGKKVVIK